MADVTRANFARWADTYEMVAGTDGLRLRSLQEPGLEMEVTLSQPLHLAVQLDWPPERWDAAELEEALVTLEETRPANVRARRLGVGRLEVSLWVYSEDLTRQSLNLSVNEVAVAWRMLVRRRDRLATGPREPASPFVSEPGERKDALPGQLEFAVEPGSAVDNPPDQAEQSASDEDEGKGRLRRPASHWMPPPLTKKTRAPVPEDPGFYPRPLPSSSGSGARPAIPTFNPFAEEDDAK